MVWNLLTGAADKTREFSNIGEAALYGLLGFMVVFAGIAFLILVVWLAGRIMMKVTGKTKKKPQPKVKEEPQAKPAPKTEDDEITDETVAIITAAIMAYYQQNDPKCEFTVKRIKRI